MSRFNIGDRVKVISDCLSKGKEGTVKDRHLGDRTVVELDGVHPNNRTRTFDNFSLGKISNNTPCRSVDSSNMQVAVFFEENQNNLEFESTAICDFIMVWAESPQDAVDVLNDTDYYDVEFETLLFGGKLYSVKHFCGLKLEESVDSGE